MKTISHSEGDSPEGRQNKIHKTRCPIATLLIGTLTPLFAVAQVAPSASNELTVEQLKTLYLACDRASLEGRLGKPDIALCSIVYEDLKRRAFGGDFDKLLAWSRGTPSRPGSAGRRDLPGGRASGRTTRRDRCGRDRGGGAHRGLRRR